MTWARLTLAACLLALTLPTAPAATERAAVAQAPTLLSDAEFWRLVVQFSEPDGYFDSDNLVSNEDTFQYVIPELARTVPRGGVYIGVGPDQNFTYIVATRPALSFITDIRRGNLHVHLMYKALIELSSDRADFLSRLFSRPRPAGLGPHTSVDDLFAAYRQASPDRALYGRNLHAIVDRLTTHRRFALEAADRQGITSVYSQFFRGGPELRFVSSRGGNWYPSYADLQLADDGRGVHRSYLGTEDAFTALKEAEQANAIVPIVGNFAGPKALRAIADYLKARQATVSVFYTSNVERYLFQDGLWSAFVANLAALPLTDSSTLIRSCFDSCSSPGGSRAVTLLDSAQPLVRDASAGRVAGYSDVLFRSRRR